ncbi:MAG: radical SAM protein [Bacteriovoracaceae bacterium]|jgi:MoaA/NifB/PqqE/SkfB family radical SAM enzyme|nr:radical SAM protein [Bacteriovoracaceae bacterium]
MKNIILKNIEDANPLTQGATSTNSLNFKFFTPRQEHPDFDQLNFEAKALAQEATKTQELPQTGIQKLKRMFKSYKTTAINWIKNKKRVSENREDLLPLYFIWSILRTCNFLCDYCDDHRGNKYPEMSNKGALDTDQAKKLLGVMRTRTPSVYYAGGEPTLRSDLPEILRHGRNLNYFPQIINTNGSVIHKLLKRKNWSNFLADFDIIIVSLDSLRVDMLNEMYRYKKSEDIIRNVLALRELRDTYGFKLMVNCVVQPGRIQDAVDVLNFANDLGITFAGVPQNDGPVAKDGLLLNLEYRKFVSTLLTRHKAGHKFAGSYRMNNRLYNGVPLNCRNTLKPHIDFDGTLFWPCKACVNVQPEKLNILAHKHLDEVWAKGRKMINPDKFHGPAPTQCGANCNWAQNYTTDTYYHGLKNPASILTEIRDFLN